MLDNPTPTGTAHCPMKSQTLHFNYLRDTLRQMLKSIKVRSMQFPFFAGSATVSRRKGRLKRCRM